MNKYIQQADDFLFNLLGGVRPQPVRYRPEVQPASQSSFDRAMSENINDFNRSTDEQAVAGKEPPAYIWLRNLMSKLSGAGDRLQQGIDHAATGAVMNSYGAPYRDRINQVGQVEKELRDANLGY